MKSNYFHISKLSSKDNIQKYGLVADVEGNIFLFNDIAFADAIALNQLGLDEYIIFEIDSEGFKIEPVIDNVAEYTASHQWIIKQPSISPEFINFIGEKKVDAYLQSLKENVRIYDLCNLEFRNFKYKEKVKYLAEEYKKMNKGFYDYLMNLYRNL